MILINFTAKSIVAGNVIKNGVALITARKIYFLKSALCNKPFYAIFPLGFPNYQPVDFNSSPFVFGVCVFWELEYIGQKRCTYFHSLLNLIRFVCIFRRCKFHSPEEKTFHSKAFSEMIVNIAKTIQGFGREKVG